MRFLGVSTVKGHGPHSGRKIAWALCALFAIATAPELWANGTPAGTQITASAEVSYEAANGFNYTASDTAVVTVGQVAGTDLEPPLSSISDPGLTVIFAHSLVNVGNGADSFAVAATSQVGWPVRVYLDADRNGGLDAGDPEITGPITLAADDTAHLLVAVDVPGSAAVRGTIDTVDVQAASLYDSSSTDQLQDVLEIRDVGIIVNLDKDVDLVSATVGDVLNYSVAYSASGTNTATSFEIADPIPFGSSYMSGTMRWNGALLTDASDADGGYYDAAGNRVVFQIGDIAGGEGGTVDFQVRVESSAAGVVTNSARSGYVTLAGTDSVSSDTVQTTIVLAQLALEKILLGPTVAMIGEEVRYLLRYGNPSASVEARDMLVTDTLPTGLEFVSAQPQASVSDSILTWALGDLAPGDTSEIQLTVRVSDTVQDTIQASNVAVLAAMNAANAELAQAEPVELIGMYPTQLSLDKTADVLEVGLGETAPYTLTVENIGAVALSDIRVHDRLPEGGRYSNGSLIGADSIQANNRDLTIFYAGPLAPGESHSIHYAMAVISAEEETISNTAYATAENELVRSDDVVAWVNVRTSWPMETRAAIGKVWVDVDNDGVQDAGEPGIEGAEIWTDDGAVTSTDAQGKFSLRNLRPGGHSFRLDPLTVPVSYRVASNGFGDELVTLNADGWTSPRVNFRLIPREGTLREVRLPVEWRFTARPLRFDLDEICSEALGGEEPLLSFDSNSARPPIDPAFIGKIGKLLIEWPDCWLKIAGHADSRPIHGGPYTDNWHLSEARAESVAHRLIEMGLESRRVLVRGYGDSRPIATGDDTLSHKLNRRVELSLVKPRDGSGVLEPVVEYEVMIKNTYDQVLSGLSVRFDPGVDSAAIVIDSTITPLTVGPVTLPPIPPQSSLVLRGWTVSVGDSAVAILESTDRPGGAQILAAIHNPLMPVSAVSEAMITVASLPNPAAIPAGHSVEAVIDPAPAGWPELIFRLPAGWVPVAGSAHTREGDAPDPAVRYDHQGEAWLFWNLDGRRPGQLSLRLEPARAPEAVETVSVPALRTAEERDEERRRAFIAGPAVEVFEPRDGTVLRSDRLYIGVRGEPNAPIALFDGDSLIAEATVRIDGIHDFIAIPLSRGPHNLRLRMKNSWGQERWDSLSVHVTGQPAAIVSDEEPVQLTADGHSAVDVRAQVLDSWGVPVISPAYVTVSVEGAEPINKDADASSVGLQIQSDAAGWLHVRLRPGHEIGVGRLTLSAGAATREIELEILPQIRPLMISGVGRIGLGASPDAFGAVTAKGRLDRRTSLTLSLDTRELDAGRDAFGRTYDPLEAAQYPILGDASRGRVVSSSDYFFSAHLERGFDWLTLGDVTTSDFASGLNLSSYQRSLSGAATHVATGPVLWKAFGSSTSQSLQQQQIRGAGTSGPYDLQPDIRVGTDQIVLETRDRANAARALSRQTLIRFIDYQIDYARGSVLFKRPVPAADTHGNPVFIVVSFEAETGGPREATWGVRATADAGDLVGASGLDSLRIGATWVSEGRSDGDRHLAGADVRLIRYGGLDLGAELSYSASPDSSGFAAEVSGSLSVLNDRVNVSAGWMKIGDEFHNPSNVALQGGTEEIRLGGGLKVGAGELRIEHERESFEAVGVERQRTAGGIAQPLSDRLRLDAGLTADRLVNGGVSDNSQAGQAKLTWAATPDLSLWTEARQLFSSDGAAVEPSHVGAGAAYKVHKNVSLETRFRRVMVDDTTSYSVTNLGIRSDLGLGTQAWGSYQIAGGVDGVTNAAIVGLNNRLRLGNDWSFNTLFERRVGLNQASVADPVRALPFVQPEEDYWSAALGVEYLPIEAPYRLSARGEYKDGDFQSTRLINIAGDVSLNRSLAVLMRNEYVRTEQILADGLGSSRRTSSLWGLAFRPVGNDNLNVLTKFEWLDENDALGGGVLAAQGDEQRVIGAAEAIWAPYKSTEFAARYAMRRTAADQPLESGATQNLVSWADYIGGRMQFDVHRWLGFRSEGRLLIEHTSSSKRWDFAPSVVFFPVEGFEAALGYRFGDLRDPDFAVRGGHGAFLVFSARITERVFPTTAEFWRSRLERD